MPEGPECRIMFEGLQSAAKNKKLVKINILGGRFIKKEPVGLATLQLPSVVTGGGVKGKFIWLELENEMTLWITLGMSGFWSIEKLPHSHLSLEFEEGFQIYFVDQRRFGTFKVAHRSELPKKLDSLGLDLLNSESSSMFDMLNQFKKVPNKTIVEALMDQRLFAGIGNYIKCEMLYCTKIHPLRLVKDIDAAEVGELYHYGKAIMEASYRQGGASIRNYQDINANKGEFVFTLKAYAQKQDPFGNPVERLETPDGRTTHWVPAIQR